MDRAEHRRLPPFRLPSIQFLPFRPHRARPGDPRPCLVNSLAASGRGRRKDPSCAAPRPFRVRRSWSATSTARSWQATRTAAADCAARWTGTATSPWSTQRAAASPRSGPCSPRIPSPPGHDGSSRTSARASSTPRTCPTPSHSRGRCAPDGRGTAASGGYCAGFRSSCTRTPSRRRAGAPTTWPRGSCRTRSRRPSRRWDVPGRIPPTCTSTCFRRMQARARPCGNSCAASTGRGQACSWPGTRSTTCRSSVSARTESSSATPSPHWSRSWPATRWSTARHSTAPRRYCTRWNGSAGCGPPGA